MNSTPFYQSLLIMEKIFLLKEKLDKNPMVPVIKEKETDARSMQLKYINPEEKRVMFSWVQK